MGKKCGARSALARITYFWEASPHFQVSFSLTSTKLPCWPGVPSIMPPLLSLDPGAPLGTVSNATNVVKSLMPGEHNGVVMSQLLVLCISCSMVTNGEQVMAVAGILSCTFVSILLLYILLSALSPWLKSQPDSPTPFTCKQISLVTTALSPHHAHAHLSSGYS